MAGGTSSYKGIILTVTELQIHGSVHQVAWALRISSHSIYMLTVYISGCLGPSHQLDLGRWETNRTPATSVSEGTPQPARVQTPQTARVQTEAAQRQHSQIAVVGCVSMSAHCQRDQRDRSNSAA